MPGIPPTSSNPAGERHDALVRKLGYEGRPTFITGQPGDRLQVSSHVVRQALTAMRIQGVYALGDGFPASASLKPIVYTAFAHDWQAVQAIRKDVWSQAAVPFLLVATPDTVEICSGFAPPSAPTRSIHFDRHDEVLPDVLADFSAERISSSLTWNDFDIRRKSSVDNELVDAIEALNERARHEFPELEDDRDLINAMIGRFIYTYVLADRQILSPDWLAGRLPEPAPRDGSPFVNAVFGIGAVDEDWTARAAFEVFDIVDEAINGSVFSLSPEQRSRVPDGLCRLIHRTVRRGEKLYRGSSQLGFFDVSFAILRTETISAIYERFVSIEGSERRRDDGVFYTPPHLADHVLDRVEAVSPIDERSRLLDPAAGSGIFLVGAFRRVMEKHAPDGGWHPGHINRAKSLLLRTIHGIEKHPQAANVCRFSLYLTLLDYVGRAPIEELVAAAGSEKFLPDLSGNVRSSDAFEVGVMAGGFSHVVGNPPWTSTAGQRDRSNKRIDAQEEPAVVTSFVAELRFERISFAHNRLSDLFTWLALRRHAADGGTVGFVLPTRSLIGRSAHGFAHQLAREATVRWVGNLSHLRRKLFEGGEAPACVVVAVNRKPTYLDRAAVYRPLLTSLPGGRSNEIWALLASNAEIRTIRSADLQHGRSGWFLQCMLGELDRRMHEALVSWSVMNRRTVGDFLKRSRLVMSKGGSFEETGVQRGEFEGKRSRIHHLGPEEMLGVTPAFRGWFSGNVILVPRSLSEATYERRPVAYPSTFNAIIPVAQERAGASGPIDSDRMPVLGQEGVTGLLQYLNSSVFRYFASVFGASYLIDKARFEKNDLLSLPCPFDDLDDRKLTELGNTGSVDDAILDAMDAGGDFRAAFEEFKAYRKHYANAQVPPGSFSPVSGEKRQTYLGRLRDELGASLGRTHDIRTSVRESGSRHAYVTVAFGIEPPTEPPEIDVTGQFLASSIVLHDRVGGTCLIVKSVARHAWTIEQAVTDAVAVTREMRGGR